MKITIQVVAYCLVACLVLTCMTQTALAQSVCLPQPRLLTTMPMGGQAGTQVEVMITGELLDSGKDGGTPELIFSNPLITATAKLDEKDQPVPGRFQVTIDKGCPVGVHDARVMTQYGLSSARAFSVNDLPEITQDKPSTTLDSAVQLEVGSICNASLADRGVNHYRFDAKAGQRIFVDCGAGGIDSKLEPVLIVADANGDDLVAQRRGDCIEFDVPSDGAYMLKIHDLTFRGGKHTFYRLLLKELPAGTPAVRLAATRDVGSFSWPPAELVSADGKITPSTSDETEAEFQSITLPCDIAGSFSEPADIDSYEFKAKKGEEWWVEVASQRLGRPTDPTVLVQRLVTEGETNTWIDVTTMNDIPSPIKVSSNHYTYDGPPYNAGSADVLGKLTIPADGTYRLHLSDLFGGTRSDPRNIYRLVIRKPKPDFSIAAWALHRQLRNGDRRALSKPIALRPGQTMALDVVAIRRDGYDGAIEIGVDNLPDGVTGHGLTIPAGMTSGHLLISADLGAPPGFSIGDFYGEAKIGESMIRRTGQLAALKWPVTDHRSEIPSPRLMARFPVSVGSAETVAMKLAPKRTEVLEAVQDGKLTLDLVHMRQGEFSGKTVAMQTLGFGFTKNPKFDLKLADEESQVEIDLAKLKVAPGDYRIAFIGGPVVKYAPPTKPTANDEKKKPTKPVDIAEILVSYPINLRVLPKDNNAQQLAAATEVNQ